MSNLNCPCGNQLSDVGVPSRNKGWMLRDIDIEDNPAIKGRPDPISDGVDVWECDECGRIAFGNNTDNTMKWFIPESGNYEKLCDFDPTPSTL